MKHYVVEVTLDEVVVYDVHKVVGAVDLFDAFIRLAILFVDRAPRGHESSKGLLAPEHESLGVYNSRLDDLLVAENTPGDRIHVI